MCWNVHWVDLTLPAATHFRGYLNNRWWSSNALTSSVWCLGLMNLSMSPEYAFNETRCFIRSGIWNRRRQQKACPSVRHTFSVITSRCPPYQQASYDGHDQIKVTRPDKYGNIGYANQPDPEMEDIPPSWLPVDAHHQWVSYDDLFPTSWITLVYRRVHDCVLVRGVLARLSEGVAYLTTQIIRYCTRQGVPGCPHHPHYLTHSRTGWILHPHYTWR